MSSILNVSSIRPISFSLMMPPFDSIIVVPETIHMATGAKNKKSVGKVCGNCSVPEKGASKLSACARCGLVAYCSKEYQRAHWKANHKQHCVSKADRVSQAPKSSDIFKKSEPSWASAVGKGVCSICLDSLDDLRTTTLKCKHTFHVTCVDMLRKFGMNQARPLCRKPLSLGPENYGTKPCVDL